MELSHFLCFSWFAPQIANNDIGKKINVLLYYCLPCFSIIVLTQKVIVFAIYFKTDDYHDYVPDLTDLKIATASSTDINCYVIQD